MNDQPEQSATPRTDAAEELEAHFAVLHETCSKLRRENAELRQKREAALKALEGRLDNDMRDDPLLVCAMIHVAAEDHLPDEFDSEDYCLNNAVDSLVRECAALRAKLAEAEKEAAEMREFIEFFIKHTHRCGCTQGSFIVGCRHIHRKAEETLERIDAARQSEGEK